MGYRFPLDTVLRVRELAVETEERTLGRILAELEALREALVRTEAELQDTATAREQAFAGTELPAMHLHASYAVAGMFRARREALTRQIEVFEDLRQKQVVQYEEAYRRREVLISLRDSGREAWVRAQNKREEKAADEAFLNKRVREARLPRER